MSSTFTLAQIKKALNQSVVLSRFPNQILYSLISDRQFLQEQNNKYEWNYDWQYDKVEWQDCTFNTQNRLIQFNCFFNTQIKELDLSQCTQLQELYCSKDVNIIGDVNNMLHDVEIL